MDDYEDEHLEAGMVHMAERLVNVTEEREELRRQLEAAERRLNWMLSRCVVNRYDDIALPCGNWTMTDADKKQSLGRIDAALAKETTHE